MRNRILSVLKLENVRLISWIEVVLLAAMAPLFIFPSMDSVWVVLAFPVLWAVRWRLQSRQKTDGFSEGADKESSVKGSRPSQRALHMDAAGIWAEDGLSRSRWAGTSLDAAMLLLAVQLIVSSVAAGDWDAMLPKIMGILYGILVFFALVRILRTKLLLVAGLSIFLTGGAVLAVIGVTGVSVMGELHFRKIVKPIYEILPSYQWNFEGAEAGLNPNAVAGVMLLFVPLCLGVAFGLAKKRAVAPLGAGKGAKAIAILIFGMLSIFFLLVLFLAQSVGAWLALVAGIWIVLPFRKLKIIGAGAVLGVALLALVVFPEMDPVVAENRKKTYWIGKIEARYLRWTVGIDAVREKPITGVGVNMLRWRPELGYEHAHAHNHILHTAAELGIPGAIAYLAILGGALWLCRVVLHCTGSFGMRTATRGLAAGQVSHFIFGLGDSIPLGAKPGIFFWVSLALIVAVYNRSAFVSRSQGIVGLSANP